MLGSLTASMDTQLQTLVQAEYHVVQSAVYIVPGLTQLRKRKSLVAAVYSRANAALLLLMRVRVIGVLATVPPLARLLRCPIIQNTSPSVISTKRTLSSFRHLLSPDVEKVYPPTESQGLDEGHQGSQSLVWLPADAHPVGF